MSLDVSVLLSLSLCLPEVVLLLYELLYGLLSGNETNKSFIMQSLEL